MSNIYESHLTEDEHRILDDAENQIGDQLFYNWTRELKELLHGSRAEIIREYMLDGVYPHRREEAEIYYGFKAREYTPEQVAQMERDEFTDEERLNSAKRFNR